MILKQYQKEVLADLDHFIDILKQNNRLDIAYEKYWEERGISLRANDDYLHPYDNSITGVPRITMKIPTAGGKTFVACHALRHIFDHYTTTAPQVVAWFVPSDTLLAQTFQNLNNPLHPYRQSIDVLFNNRVQVVSKEMALEGQHISPAEITEQLTIFVFSVQSFVDVVRNGLPRVYRQNSNLDGYRKTLLGDEGQLVEQADETSLINWVAGLQPVVIIDESHNFEADLRVDLLNSINPCFILELTATPRKRSNIISFVDAMKLKKEHMVKLPVIVYNSLKVSDVIVNAINLRRNLERRARAEQESGGDYIRPIVLFQAQPKSDNENITFDKIRQQLVEAGIPEEHIKIKTAERNELKGIDLASPACEVRYIITVNALKEGWDCPFAYILASLANRTSRVDVEQILGRILRLPHTREHTDEYLNLSYVFTSSNAFKDTLDNIISSLNKAGFSARDYRLAEPEAERQGHGNAPATLPDLFPQPQDSSPAIPASPEMAEDDKMNIDANEIKERLSSAQSYRQTEDFLHQAQAQNQDYNQQLAQNDPNENIPTDIMDKLKRYPMKDSFKPIVSKLCLPNFFIKVPAHPLFTQKVGEYLPLKQEFLLKGFNLDTQDRNIDFDNTVTTSSVSIDLEERNSNEYVPKYKTLSSKQTEIFKEQFFSSPVERKIDYLAKYVGRQISQINALSEPQIIRYIKGALQPLSNETLSELANNEVGTARAFKEKIIRLMRSYAEKQFAMMLDTGEIICQESYTLPERITLTDFCLGIPKALYAEEEKCDTFEYQVIRQIAELDNVLCWHRNQERGKGFGLNGYTHNHYPDFIVILKNGHVILVETKGRHLDNSDSKSKIKLGRAWADKAGSKYRYFMVYEGDTPLEGSWKVSDAINIIQRIE